MKQILITGGAGYLGSVLALKLLNNGYYVKILDPLIFGKESVEGLFNNNNCEIQIGNVNDNYLLDKLVKGCYAIIHLSGLSNDPSCELDAELTLKANVASTKKLIEYANKYKIKKLLYASSCSVYGFSELISNEESKTNPLTAYAKSKLESESILMNFESDVSVTALRKATLFGPSPRMRFDLVVNTMTGSALADKKIIINGGNQWRPFLHVSDAADAYLYLLEQPGESINRQIYNIGSNENNLTINELSLRIKEIIPDTIIEKSENDDHRSYKVSFNKIDSLGWKSKLDIESGVMGIRELFSNGIIHDFRDINYFNIKRMISFLNI